MCYAPLHEIFCSLFPDDLLALLVEETNRYYDQIVAAQGGRVQPYIIDQITNVANVRRLCASILFQMVSHTDRVQGRMHRCFPQSVTSTCWIRSPRSTSSSKTRSKALDISSLEFYPLLRSSIYPPVTVHVSHNGCRRFKTKP